MSEPEALSLPGSGIRGLRGLFVTGTDTGVGKTWVSSALASAMTRAGVRVGVIKPVATGATRVDGEWRSEDTEALIAAIGREVPRHRVTPILFEEPLAPPVAARRAGEPLDFGRLLAATEEAIAWWSGPGGAEVVVVEGVGGLLCPIAERKTVADLAVALDFPVVVVARRGLGTLNHTLLTVEASLLRGLRLAGVVLNGAEPIGSPIAEQTNPEELSRWLGNVPLLAELEHQCEPSAFRDRHSDLNWSDRAAKPRFPSRADQSGVVLSVPEG